MTSGSIFLWNTSSRMDSLAVVEAVMTCETEFDIEIDPDAKPATIGEFAEIVDGLIAEKN